MPVNQLVEVWNLSATSGDYGYVSFSIMDQRHSLISDTLLRLLKNYTNCNCRALINGHWQQLWALLMRRWLLFLHLFLLTVAADWTGNAIIASTGIKNSTGSIPQVADSIPFTLIKRRYAPSDNRSPEMGNYIFSSGTAYSHILRHVK